MGLGDLVTQTEADYINLAVKLVQDKPYREQVSQRIRGAQDILYEDLAPIRAFEDFLIKLH
jgi:predicted O-linked N-acetylglucosamine transferase (SPINDLY family)